MLSPGDTVERYTVDAPLGEGGMAVVYLVHHQHLGTRHALKVLTLTHPKVRERFLQEGRVQATIRHPNVVAVTDFLEVNGAPAMIMEYVEGPTLAGWLAKGRPSLDEAEAVFRGVLAGVEEAHRLGLVHRDLKPANVLLATVDGKPFPKVADFGLVKLAQTTDSGHTASGMTMGTPAYMAPEQVRDAKRVDSRADVFALGCILYELVTGEQPFVGKDLVELLTNVTTGRYTAPEQIVPDLPERFRATIAGCLAVAVDARIPDCASVADALSGGKAATVPAPPSRPPSKPPASRPAAAKASPSRTGAGAPALVGAILGGAIGLTLLTGLVGVVAWRFWGPSGDVAPTPMSALADVVAHDPNAVCDGASGETIGWIRHTGWWVGKRKGGSWTLPSDEPVYAAKPDPADGYKLPTDVVCRLPKGTKIELDEAGAVGSTGTWIEVVGGSIDLP